jgi:small subunit ribosomal protein S16
VVVEDQKREFKRNMLAIRLQRTGRKGHAMFRVVVQDSRRTPTSGKIVAQLGTYDPHAKAVALDNEKAGFYLTNGAQPSPRVAVLLQGQGVSLPEWVATAGKKTGAIRNPEKLRRNKPQEKAPEAPADALTQDTEVVAAEAATPAE